MINFLHTLCVCILALFGWYQPMESNAQQPIDAQNKNAYLYTDRIILSMTDFLDYYRFQSFLTYLTELKGSDNVGGFNWSFTFYNSAYGGGSNDLYITSAYAVDNMSGTTPNSIAGCRDLTISNTVYAPINNGFGRFYYNLIFHAFDGSELIHLCAMRYINTPPSTSGTLLDNPTYFWVIDYDNITYNSARVGNLWSTGIVFLNTQEDLYKGWYSKGLPIDNDDEWQTGYESGYSFGFTDGYNDGLDDGNQQGYQTGYNDGNTQGYQTGYASGLLDGQSYDQTALTIFTGIIEVGLLPVNIFLQMFNYEIFGINISGVVSALLTISIVIIIVRFLLGKKDD